MSKPPVEIGNLYESRDKREHGRRVVVHAKDPDTPDRWICRRVYGGGVDPDHISNVTTKLSTKNLQRGWKLVVAQGDTLQALLRRLESVHPSDLPASLVDLRHAWLKAGCPGLRR